MDKFDTTLYDETLGYFPEDSLDESCDYDTKDFLKQSGFNVNED